MIGLPDRRKTEEEEEGIPSCWPVLFLPSLKTVPPVTIDSGTSSPRRVNGVCDCDCV